jgi:anti-anti-sigma factor
VESQKLTIQEIEGRRGGEQVLKLAGPLVLTTLFELRNAVQATTAPLLILDLSDVPYMDSAGLGVLVNAHVSCMNRGRRLALVGLADRVLTLIVVTNVDRVLTIFPTLQAAEEVLSKDFPASQQ